MVLMGTAQIDSLAFFAMGKMQVEDWYEMGVRAIPHPDDRYRTGVGQFIISKDGNVTIVMLDGRTTFVTRDEIKERTRAAILEDCHNDA